MGIYINPDNCTKEEWINLGLKNKKLTRISRKEAQKAQTEEIYKTLVPVAHIRRQAFDALLVCTPYETMPSENVEHYLNVSFYLADRSYVDPDVRDPSFIRALKDVMKVQSK